MRILEHYDQKENETLLVGSNGLDYFVAFNVLTEVNEGLGYVDYDTPLDEDETTTEIEILVCYVCNDKLEKTSSVLASEVKVITEYLLNNN